MMKKFIWISSVIIMIIFLSGCDFFGSSSDSELDIMLNPGVDTIEVFSDFTNSGATAKYGDETIQVLVVEENLNTDLVGAYYIKYQAVKNDLVAEAIRIVVVIDSTKPTMTLKAGIDTVSLGEAWIDSGVNVTDNYDQNISASVSGYVDINIIGTYVLTYLAIDNAGNQCRIIRVVNVM